jgi:hypothetical protein
MAKDLDEEVDNLVVSGRIINLAGESTTIKGRLRLDKGFTDMLVFDQGFGREIVLHVGDDYTEFNKEYSFRGDTLKRITYR